MFWGKKNANEDNESLLSNCRVQLFFCKVTKKRADKVEKLPFYFVLSSISIIFASEKLHSTI